MARIKEFQEIMRKKKVDIFLAMNTDFSRLEYDMAYFTGYGSIGALIIPQQQKPFLIVPRMEKERAKRSGVLVYSPPKGMRISAYANEILKKKGVRTKKAGINKEEMTIVIRDSFRKALKARFVDLRKDIYKLREQKTADEIKTIREGCKISDSILEKCFREFKNFQTEAAVKAFLEIEAKKRGCEIAFPTIVASGPNARMAHYDICDKKLMNGFCIIDYGIRYKNYCTDTTRTVYIGEPSKKEIELYNLVLSCQRKAIESSKIGAKCSKIYEGAVADLGKYGKYFTHGLGHGFGIKVHEAPDLTPKSKYTLKEYMTFTIEPGVYLDNLGIRIEDDILITDRTEILTRAKKELVVITRGRT